MIIQNAATCLACGDFIVSKHRHDFVTCTCGAVSVDGGQSYIRRVGDFANATDHSWELPDALYDACATAAEEAMESNRNHYGIANAVMRTLREAGRVVADHEPRIFAENNNLDEIMVEEADGTVNRYKKIVE